MRAAGAARPAGRSGSCSGRCGPAGLRRWSRPSGCSLATFGGDVVAVEGPDDFAGGVDDVDPEVVLRLGAADRVAEAGVAEAEVEGLARASFRRRRGSARRRWARVAGVPVGLPAAAGCRPGWAAPPRRRGGARGKAASAARPARNMHDLPPTRPGVRLLRTACPLFRSPAELAVGLALKEMRYGRFRPIRPWRPATVPAVPPLPSGCPDGIRHCWRGSIDTAAASRSADGYHPRPLGASARLFL